MQVLNTSTPVASIQFTVPSAKKLTLIYLSVDGLIVVGGVQYDVPTVARLAGAVGQFTGEAIDAVGLIGTNILENRGAIHATDKQAFRGCWELPQGVTTYTLDALFAEANVPAGPWTSISARINMMFET